jgi:hypothetical protein
MEPQKIGFSKGEALWIVLEKLKVTLKSQFLICLLLGSNNAPLQTAQDTASKDRKLWDLEQNVVHTITHSVVYVIICFHLQETKYFWAPKVNPAH